MFKKILIGLGIFVVVIIAISAVSVNSTQGPSRVDQSTNSHSKTENREFKVGDVVKLGDREFIVNSVKRSSALGYSSPKSGKEFIVVNVTIRNLGKDEVSYNPFDFKVQDANGAQEGTTFAVIDDSLNSGTLVPNGNVTGSMPFEVPIGTAAKLIFQPSFWSEDKIVVNLLN